MNRALLITRPNHDPGTNYLFYWSKPIISFASSRDVKVLDLLGPKANLKYLTSYIKKNNPRFLFLNGHGSPESVCGSDNQTLVCLSNCKDLLNDKIVYARCCESAAVLGLFSIKQGASAFIGYSKAFKFYVSSDKITRPLEDEIAGLFLEPSNLIPRTILKGNSVEDAHKKSIKEMIKNLHSTLSSAATSEMRACAPLLFHDIKYQTFHGDKDACL